MQSLWIAKCCIVEAGSDGFLACSVQFDPYRTPEKSPKSLADKCTEHAARKNIRPSNRLELYILLQWAYPHTPQLSIWKPIWSTEAHAKYSRRSGARIVWTCFARHQLSATRRLTHHRSIMMSVGLASLNSICLSIKALFATATRNSEVWVKTWIIEQKQHHKQCWQNGNEQDYQDLDAPNC